MVCCLFVCKCFISNIVSSKHGRFTCWTGSHCGGRPTRSCLLLDCISLWMDFKAIQPNHQQEEKKKEKELD